MLLVAAALPQAFTCGCVGYIGPVVLALSFCRAAVLDAACSFDLVVLPDYFAADYSHVGRLAFNY